MKNGFTLFEVMIALAIIGSAVTVILTFASTLFKTTTKSSRSIERIIEMKNMLNEIHQNQNALHTQQRGFPVMNMKYAKKPLSEKSAFKGIKNLVTERIDAEWTDIARRTDTLIFFQYEPELKKSDSKPA